MQFQASILTPNPTLRRPIVTVLAAALAAVDPRQATLALLHEENGIFTVGQQRYDLNRFQRIFIVGAGKAGAPMAQAVETVLGERISTGLVVVKTGHSAATARVEIVEATHPVPDAAGVAAGQRILALAESAGADDLVIALLSGGGSALLVSPAEGLTLADKQQMTGALLACGATIQEMNCLRKHCSALKGGQLARAVAPATLITLVLSDVVGSPLDVIASGPTVPDKTTWADAWAVVEKYQLVDKLPAAIVARLRAGLAGEIADTPKPGDPVFEHAPKRRLWPIILSLAEAACAQAQSVGFNPLLLTTYLEGEAGEVAKVVVALAKQVQASGQPAALPACLVLGGETTVTLGANPGQGGRNQELALSAALALQGSDRHYHRFAGHRRQRRSHRQRRRHGRWRHGGAAAKHKG